MANPSTKSVSMADLMANYSSKPIVKIERGDEISGKIISVSSTDIILDLGAKTEGVLSIKELPKEQQEGLKIGQTIKAFVVTPENDNGQTILSVFPPVAAIRGGAEVLKKWQKFIDLKNGKGVTRARVLEVNKGGLMMECGGIRGFLPSSQIGALSMQGIDNLTGLVGKELTVSVIEIDPQNNRIIFSSRQALSPEILQKLTQYRQGQQVKGKVTAILPFGAMFDVDGVEGMMFAAEAAWEKVDDLAKVYNTGDTVDLLVVGVDESAGRLLLSARRMSADPFEKTAAQFLTDDVVKGTVVEVSPQGVVVDLGQGVSGFVLQEAVEPGTDVVYTPGQQASFIVAGVDRRNRRINLSPFITSTKGLIYK